MERGNHPNVQEIPEQSEEMWYKENSSSTFQQAQHQHTLCDVPLQSGDQQLNAGEQRTTEPPIFHEVPEDTSEEQDISLQGGHTRPHKIQKNPHQREDKNNSDFSSKNPYAHLVDSLRDVWMSGKTRPIEYRKGQLEALGRFLDEKETDILHAIHKDLHTPAFEAQISEIALAKSEVNYALNNLCYWMKDEHVDKSQVTKYDDAFIRKDPYGVVLIIATFNVPIQLTLLPLVGAIGAGNCAIIKPSELSSCTERFLAETLPCYLDPKVFAVVTGGPEETTKLLENKFDYILFSGSSQVGKTVMSAASRHLTPLTLELGGKNPCYVDRSCDFQNAANRIVWGKFFIAGQSCVAPDYVICAPETQEKLMPCLRQAIREFYGKNPKNSPDFARLINKEHFKHLQAFLDCDRVAIGGKTDEDDLYIAPTVLADVKEWEPVMQEEIFGPILPIITVEDMDEAIKFINSRPRPLALYAFSSDYKIVNRVLECTRSGGFCGNDTLMHSLMISLPFGGIGYSGFGKYHGKFSFDTFTHERGCLYRSIHMEKLNYIRYPPYTEQNLKQLLSETSIKRKGLCTLL